MGGSLRPMLRDALSRELGLSGGLLQDNAELHSKITKLDKVNKSLQASMTIVVAGLGQWQG